MHLEHAKENAMQDPTIWYVNVFVREFERAVDGKVYYLDEFRDG